MTANINTGPRRKRRQRRLLWAISFALIVPLPFVSFDVWLAWFVVGIVLAVPVLGIGVGLLDMIYNITGDYDRSVTKARDRFSESPPVSDEAIPTYDPNEKRHRKRSKRAKKSKIGWLTNSFFWIRPGGFR